MSSHADYESSSLLSSSSILSASISSPYLTAALANAALTATTNTASTCGDGNITDAWNTNPTSPYMTSNSRRTNSTRNSRLATRPQSIPRSHAGLLLATQSGGIRKRHSSRHRSASAHCSERVRHSSLGANNIGDSLLYTSDQDDLSSLDSAWHTPQHSPQPISLFSDPDVSLVVDPSASYQAWSVPTPPCSDSGCLALVSIDAAHDHGTPAAANTADLCGTDFNFEDAVASVEMSSLGYLLPGQYANGLPSQPDTSDYDMESNRAQSVTAAPSPYTQTASSSPSLYQGRIVPQYGDGRHMSSTPGSVYGGPGRRMTDPYSSPATSDYSLPPSNSIPSMSGIGSSVPMSTIGSPNMGMMHPHYSSNIPRQPPMYDNSYYTQQQTYAPVQTHPSMYSPPHGTAYTAAPYSSDQVSRASSSDHSTRSQTQRAKAQCWEHGCNGRQFSTFSNLLRHQREKSGTATKSYCPKCGAEFTRTTARNGHLLHDKCTKSKQPSEER